MFEFSDVPLLAAPDASDHVQEDAGAKPDAFANGDGGKVAEGERVAEPAPPEAVANSYRFAGLVTLLPEDESSVDRLA